MGHAGSVRKYILLHDTELNGESSDCSQEWAKPYCNNMSLELQRLPEAFGLNVKSSAELYRGIWPAVQEFLYLHKDEWRMDRIYTHNFGLAVLARFATRPNDVLSFINEK